jgi:glycosyltransferase involved in cell wall biosynthesis
MKSVLVDASPILEGFWTGIPVFTSRLLRLLLDDAEIDPAFMIHGQLVSRAALLRALELRTGVYLRAAYERGSCIENSPGRVIDKALYPSVKTAFNFAPREASVVHDLTTIMTPEFHVEENISFHRDNIAREVASNEVTFAASEATASDINYYLGVPRGKIKVAHQFVEWPAEYPVKFRSLYPADAMLPYVLVIGTIEPRKNLSLIFSAIEDLLSLDQELNILVLGKPGWHLDQVLADEVKPFMESGRLRFTGFVSEFKKYCLLRLCRFTIFPSLIEGFGIPVLESLSVGRSVLASFSSSLPEVGGDVVTYFDPLSKEDFITKFASLYAETTGDSADLKRACLNTASRFTSQAFFAPIRQWILS